MDAFSDAETPGHGHFPLLPDSPAIDAGNDAVCHPTDQLGQPRVGPCDIGAIEFQPSVPTSVPFAAFTIKVEIKGDSFEVKGRFILGVASDGINPLMEEVSFKIGTLAMTLPAGAFELDRTGTFTFEEVVDGVVLEVKITPIGSGTFDIKAEGQGADLAGMENPVTIALTIGNDRGQATVTAEIK